MKLIGGILAVLISGAVLSVCAAEPVFVDLPKPQTKGKVSVEQALQQRRSFREPSEKPITLKEVGQLCWAAQGVTDDKGHRTAPSAMASYPLELYVLAGNVSDFDPGLYRYEPAGHRLELMKEGNPVEGFTKKAARQEWIAKAPVIFVISGKAKTIAKMKGTGLRMTSIETGLAAQGFLLQAQAMGLGSTFVGGFNLAQACKFLRLPAKDVVLGVLPVGHKAK